MNPMLGILLKLGAVIAFVVMQALIKGTGGRVPAGEVVFFRSFFAFPVILAWLAWQGQLRVGWKTANPMSHFWRGVIGTSAMGLGFVAAMFLGEQVRAFRLFAVALGMAGVMVVLAPQLTAVSEGDLGARQALGAILVLMGATFAALAQIFIRKMVAFERAATIVFYFTVTSTLLSLLTIPFGWVLPSGRDAVFLVAAGLMGGVGQGLLTSAYRFAHASVVAPFDYASMLFAIAIAYVIFAEVPARATLAGAALIVAAGILIIWRERQLGLDRDRQRKAMTPQG